MHMQAVIFGDGPMGRALAHALTERGDAPRILGRPDGHGHPPDILATAEIAFEASAGSAVRSNIEAALAAGCRAVVIATTGWNDQRALVSAALEGADAAGVWASNFSLGTALFGRLVDEAAVLYGRIEAFEPFMVEWHRRAKRDRPSGTARDLAMRVAAGSARTEALEIASIRAGSSPGMHLVGFDAPGETVELRITARDRSAYAAGALAAADWLRRQPRAPGLHPFDSVVDELVAGTLPSGDGHPSPAAIATIRRTQ
jgi:4-hydroxy-tetrahydrodipicolinate reductase